MSEKKISMRFNPNESDGLDNIIRESYDDFVRLERRNLIVVSAIMHISFFGDINPVGAKLIGVSFPNIDAQLLFIILFIICGYFLIAYSVYAYPSFRNALTKWTELKLEAMKITGNVHRYPIEAKNIVSSSRYYLWFFINYILPVSMGVVALFIGAYKLYVSVGSGG